MLVETQYQNSQLKNYQMIKRSCEEKCVANIEYETGPGWRKCTKMVKFQGSWVLQGVLRKKKKSNKFKGLLNCTQKKKGGLGMLPGADDWVLISDKEKAKPLNSILLVFSVIVSDLRTKKDRMNVVERDLSSKSVKRV